MVIKRHVFKTLMKNYPELNYTARWAAQQIRKRICTGVFLRLHDGSGSGRYLSEDYAFCRRWRDIGGKIWVDLDCKLAISASTCSAATSPKALRLQGRW